MKTCEAAHLQALSTRLPAISSRSWRSPRNFALGIGLELDGDAAIAVDLLHGPPQRLDRGRDLGDGADDGDARGDAGALQMMGHLVAHHVGLFQHLAGKGIGARGRRLR